MILKAKHKDLNKIVKIHLEVLGQTFSSRVGKQFLFDLYKNLLDHPNNGRVIVFNNKNDIEGFISTSIDFESLNRLLKNNVETVELKMIAKHLFFNPREILTFLQRLKFNAYISQNVSQPYVLTLCVSKDSQGKGIGSQLINNAANYYKRKGGNFLYVDTERKNFNAVTFYKKVGFKPYKVFYKNQILRKRLK